jgi:AcrR family transcriptional regulator
MATDGADVQSRGHGPRERMIRSALSLICRQGVSGTGMRAVVEHAGAPRGSLQHYFPRGKEQLVGEALVLAGVRAARSARPRTRSVERPSDVLASMVDAWRGWLTETDFALGCPAVATLADAAVASPGLRRAVEDTYRVWQDAVEGALIETGVPEGRAAALATLLISAVEGAVVLARARRSLCPLDDVLAELGPLMEGPQPACTGGEPA